MNALIWRLPVRVHKLIMAATGSRLVREQYECTGRGTLYYWVSHYPAPWAQRETKA